MNEFLRGWDRSKNEKTTLVLGSVSAGNVGQLSIDAIINTLNAEFFGYVNAADYVLPVFAPNPFSLENPEPAVTAFTSYHSAKSNLLLFQQRSEFIAWKKKEFLNRFVDWLKDQKFSAIVLLCGCFAYARTDKEIQESASIRYLCTEEAERYFAKVDPSMVTSIRLQKNDLDDEGTNNKPYHFPGGGVAEALYYKCVEEKLPLIVFLNYINEGDNYKDALNLAKFCDDILHFRKDAKGDFSGPPSWVCDFYDQSDSNYS